MQCPKCISEKLKTKRIRKEIIFKGMTIVYNLTDCTCLTCNHKFVFEDDLDKEKDIKNKFKTKSKKNARKKTKK